MIKAKKSLGQNFLIDKDIINIITDVVEIQNKDILEIGPGTGNLTSALLKKNPKKFIVIEKDNDLAEHLYKIFGDEIKILKDDVLNVEENSLNNDSLIVFGNLPYNISTEILCRWILNLKNNYWFDYLVLMFQKEVADRIIANFDTKNYGRLSILSNWKLKIEKVCDVKPSSFSPRPKIDSSLLLFKPKKDFYTIQNPYNLEKVTRIFFMHRRKMIKKPFNQLFNGNSQIAERLNIGLNMRPQNLNYETYYKLTDEYEKLNS
jgi:16S rRNA (adenine1518-N6/adenine1519-N6)-dimethyltransferase